MFRNKNLMMAVALALLVIPNATFCFPAVSEASGAMKIPVGANAPDFTLKSIDGEDVTLSSFFGKKVVMLDFWATWCAICVKEMPEIVKVYNDYRDKGFEVLGITLQSGDDTEVREIMQKNGINFPVLMDDRLTVATKVYGLAGPIPLKVIIGADGKVKYVHVGDYPVGENEVPYVVEDLIKEIPPQAEKAN